MAELHPNLTSRAERVISALLTEQTIEDAAHKSHVGSRTIHRWLREDEAFRHAYRIAKREVVAQAVSRIQHASGAALNVLLEVMLDEYTPPAVRVSAAKVVLEMALRGVEQEDILARVEILEQAQKAGLNGSLVRQGG